MDMSGEYRIAAPRERVWAALNDPEILRQAIPGCETLTRLSDTELEASVRSKIGPVSARFSGKVTLTDLNPPESYRIVGEGKGGAAGFAKGGATVNLEADDEATILRYVANADVGGKLAQIGSRLVQGSAKKMADEFFGRFAEIVAGAPAVEAATPAYAPALEAAAAAAAGPVPDMVWTDTGPLVDPAPPAGSTALDNAAKTDAIAAEFPGTVAAARPAASVSTGAVPLANASSDLGATRRIGAGPEIPPATRPWYTRPLVWIVAALALGAIALTR